MNEHPIIFSGEMMQAILEGKKTQTRRVIKPQPTYDIACGGHWYWLTGTWKSICVGCSTIEKFASRMLVPSVSLNHPRPRCPYGIPGDRLWVRETWGYVEGQPEIYYRADEPQMIGRQWGGFFVERWHPSIYMRRRDSRITLEVVGVRVERVQSISEDDAIAEGIPLISGHYPDYENPGNRWDTPAASFISLWDSINAKRGYSWQSNPWVWVVEFRQI